MTPTGDLEYTVKTLPASAEEIARCGTLRRRVHEWLASPDRAGKHEDDPELDEILDPSGDAWIRFLRARNGNINKAFKICLLYTSPSPRDKRQSRMPSSA